MKRPFAWIAAGACAALAACDLPLATACTDEGRFAVVAEVREAGTGTPLREAWLIIRQGTYVDSAGGPDAPPTLAAGPEREGTFDVTVRRAGYLDWEREDVAVARAGECRKLQTAYLTADLVRAP